MFSHKEGNIIFTNMYDTLGDKSDFIFYTFVKTFWSKVTFVGGLFQCMCYGVLNN